jgi:hypothetical protein
LNYLYFQDCSNGAFLLEGSCFKYIATNKSWSDANKFCHDMNGGHLAIVDSASIFDKIKSMAIQRSKFYFQIAIKLYKNCFNINQTWHKCWLDHCLCNNMPRVKFPVPKATRGHLKIAKNHYFAFIFFRQNWFQSAATSQLIEIESNAFQRWLHVTLWSIWRHFKFQNFLGDEGDCRPLQTLQTKGGTSPSWPPHFGLGPRRKKWSLF